MQHLLSYVRASEEDYGRRLVDVRIFAIREDGISSYFLAVSVRATYIRYVTVRKKMIKHESVLTFLKKLGKDSPMVSTARITHINDRNLYISSWELILIRKELQAIRGSPNVVCTPVDVIECCNSSTLTTLFSIIIGNGNARCLPAFSRSIVS